MRATATTTALARRGDRQRPGHQQRGRTAPERRTRHRADGNDTYANATVDFGFYRLTLGNRVWDDTDNDGILDPGETGLDGVTVQLFFDADANGLIDGSETTPVSTTVTSDGGAYFFGGLQSGGFYQVVVTPPAGYVSSTGTNGSAGGDFEPAPDPDADPTDSDDNGSNGSGIVATNLITLTVGLEPTGESDTTLPAGVPAPSVDANSNLTLDIGLFLRNRVGDRIWVDLDGDGIQDPAETTNPAGVLTGLEVQLYTSGNTLVVTTTTDSAGTYLFDHLIDGDYSVQFPDETTFGTQYYLSPQDQGGDDTTDSDADPSTARTDTFTLSGGANDTTRDMGIYPALSLGNTVWDDTNDDGLLNNGESGISGVTVTLLFDADDNTLIEGAEDTPILTTTTDISGTYSFSNLRQGTYQVVVPATNFDPGGALERYRSSTGANGNPVGPYEGALTPDPDTNIDNDDNGDTLPSGDVAAALITLNPAAEPDSGDDGDDTNANQTLDFGFYQRLSLGDTIWNDSDNNGVIDAGEPGLDGITVTLLFDADNDGSIAGGETSPISTTVTSGGGTYQFTDLISGTYQVVIPAANFGSGQVLEGFVSSTGTNAAGSGTYEPAPDPDGDLDNDDNGTSSGGAVASGLVDLATGEEPEAGIDGDGSNANQTLDFGFFERATLGDLVWEDLNADGDQDAGEPGIGGVTVTLLFDSNGNGSIDGAELTVPISSTLTDGSGNYQFTNLISGTYAIQFTDPTAIGYDEVTGQDRGGDDATDSDADRSTFRTIDITLNAGETQDTWDYGVYNLASIGDYVWEDLDGNGIQDDGTTGIPGVTVELSGTDGLSQSVSLSTTTDATGVYSFTDLVPGVYELTVSTPAGYAVTYQDIINAEVAGATDANDSDIDPSTGRTITTTLISNEDDDTWDAGFYQPGALGDYVWEDTNADGLQNEASTGLDGITVTLTGAGRDRTFGSGDDTNTVTTTIDGDYLFADLVPGRYRLTFDTPVGYNPTGQNVGGNDALDSDANTSTGQTAVIDIESAETDLTWDAGFYQVATLGDYVWEDTNADGDQDIGEPGLPGVTVELSGTDGLSQSVSLSTTTDATGVYSFTDLVPGIYELTFSTPSGYVPTGQDIVGDTVDSDADITTGRTITITLVSNENDDTWDAGYYRYASLGDFVWEDLNADGDQDVGEPGIPGVTVELSGTDGLSQSVSLSTTTDATGVYSFTDLVPGIYELTFSTPAGYVPTGQDQAGDTLDSDADITTGRTITTTLVSNEDDDSWDAGFYRPASIGDYVWEDTDGDGAQDETDTGIANVTVELSGTDGLGNSVLLTTTTDISGTYGFTDLVPGTYQITVTVPVGYEVTYQDNATDTTDSDIDPVTGGTVTTTLVSGENDTSWDAGLYQPASIGDRVWEDENGDGLQSGESGFSTPVTVTLTGGGRDQILGTPDDTTAVTTTVNGDYLFDDLHPNNYRLTFERPDGYAFTIDGVGTDETVDSDVPGSTLSLAATGTTSSTQLRSNEDDLTWDVGVYRVLSLGDYVWHDTDNDRTQDVGEPGIADVLIWLYRDVDGSNDFNILTDTFVVSTTTDSSGIYTFTNLISDTYLLVIPDSNFASGNALEYFRSSDAENTTDSAPDPDVDASNSDDNGVGPSGAIGSGPVTSSAVELRPNDEPDTGADGNDTYANATVDFGFYRLTLGNRVWDDTDNDGILDPGETGLDGVTVQLFFDADANGLIDGSETTPVSTTVTSDGGAYFFGGLQSGGFYQVVVTPPAGYVSSTGTNGSAGGDFEPAPDPDADPTDSDDNGSNGSGIVATNLITLTVGLEPTGESDTTLPAGVPAPSVDANSNLTLDLGLFLRNRVGDRIWVDLDGDGIQDPAETTNPAGVLTGLEVQLYTSGNTLVVTTTTDSAGTYLFDHLIDGDYSVQFPDETTFGTQYYLSPQDQGGDDTTDSDADPSTARTDTFTLSGGANDTTRDMGIYPALSLGNTVWDDTNDDGLLNNGESGISGVTVTLLFDADDNTLIEGAEDTPILTTTTDISGTYSFSNLRQGTYQVIIPAENFDPGGALERYRSSTGANANPVGPYEGALTPDPDTNIDNDDNGDTLPSGDVAAALITLNPAAEPDSGDDGDDTNANQTLDFGFYQRLSLGDTIWNDSDNNGVIDAGEPGLDGITVTLLFDADNDGSIAGGETSPISTTVTSGGGTYQFTDLISGTYQVVIPAANFGSGQVLEGFVSSTGTNAAGSGTYEPAPDPDGDLDNDDNGTSSGGAVASGLVDLATGEEPEAGIDGDGSNANQTLDFGFFERATLGDLVWEDLNADGDQDAGEPGIGGVTVTLLFDSNGNGSIDGSEVTNPISSTLTDGSGNYQFTNLISGTYAIQFADPATIGYDAVTGRDRGGDDATDSDADRSTFRTVDITLNAGETQDTWDYGVYNLASIGNYVWSDLNGDGDQDVGEPGLSGVTVELSGTDGLSNTVLLTTTTDATGVYSFTNLVPGDYQLTFSTPAGYEPTGQNQAGDTVDSDADTGTGQTIVTDLESGETDNSWDAGFYRPASIGDYVWEDTNGNGIQDEAGTGIPGVTVELSGTDGLGNSVSDSTTTDATGVYSFTDLVPGVYQLTFNTPAGYTFTGQDAGGNDALDSDADTSTGQTTVTTLSAGENDDSWDAGLYRPASIGDYVWEDTNADGDQDVGEPGIPGVTVELSGTDGLSNTVLLTTTTDATGVYSFTNLVPGDYQLTFSTPTGYTVTGQDEGGIRRPR
jgi:hypothetical protein